MSEKTFKVTQTKSAIGRKPDHIATIRGLGLRRIGHTVTLADNACNRGMVKKVYYMVKVED
ncbi:MAG: 50S ribosomal protein L30 [Succinivibrionaceae bacterium]|jgi:large subunit ribosomal protein L30|nr:50S ribosomal protein L30 [Ruminobacter sp.]MDY5778933.1 50S ribosomal protein L30 [Succinivibrionaceae bacterium]MEE1339667.1 50S ribosomal protein L30 [Succinivibrionaceae bacterium]